jgi:transposase-like protein
MSKSDRNNPKRSSASESTYTIMDFERDFPNDAVCLDWLVEHLYPEGIFCPKCQKVTKHHRVKTRTCYACQFCGHQEYPMRGTIFEDSATSLRLWFHAFFLMAQTRCGISAKQLERELGVTYKTAWRMFNKIRSLLNQDDEGPLSGIVEADEAYIGGQAKWKSPYAPARKRGRGTSKTGVLGMVERGSLGRPGRVVAKVVPDAAEASLMPQLRKRILPSSVIFTDDHRSYLGLGREGYRHSRISHVQKVYVDGDVHTNTIEGFWMLVKSGLQGAYHGVSTKHLQSYLDEYAFRYNHREDGRGMFGAFLSRIEKT